jgi:hypothetical protein
VKLYPTIPLLLAASLLIGCADKDTDEDGLTDIEEEELGTDPEKADTDGDGLDDPDELDLGTDPLVADTDGDGWTDGEEVDAETNPLYEYSHVYTGGYNVGYCDNGVAEPTGPTGQGSYSSHRWDAYQVGDVVENFTLVDQHGEMVDLYSFCGQIIALSFGAFW